MDKVIIDGVDVSECIYFRMNNKMAMCRACNSGVGSPYCEYHKDCYFKQFKQLQAEYDDLHLSYAGCKTANTGLQELNNSLEKENIHYKLLFAQIRTIAKTGIEGFCPECSLKECDENNCYETAILDIYDLLKKENED